MPRGEGLQDSGWKREKSRFYPPSNFWDTLLRNPRAQVPKPNILPQDAGRTSRCQIWGSGEGEGGSSRVSRRSTPFC